MNDTPEGAADHKELIEALDRFSIKTDALLRGGFNSGNAQIHVNAGGAGVWVATTCCLVMLGCMIVGSVIGSIWTSREFSRVDKELDQRKGENERMQSYLNAIYVQAPELKPKEE